MNEIGTKTQPMKNQNMALSRRPLWTAAAAALLSIIVAPVVQAQLVAFDLTGVPSGATPSVTPSVVAPGLSSSDLTRGPGLDATSLTAGFSSTGWSKVEAEMDGRANALTVGDYFALSVTVEAGSTFSFGTLDINLRRSALNAPMNFEWQFSFDDFATSGTTITPTGPVWTQLGWTGDTFTYFGRQPTNTKYLSDDAFLYMTERVDGLEGAPMPTIDLSGISELQNVSEGTTLSFRLYGWGNASTNPGSNTVATRYDGMVLGATPIPEPSTYALLFGVVALGAAFVVRRRKR